MREHTDMKNRRRKVRVRRFKYTVSNTNHNNPYGNEAASRLRPCSELCVLPLSSASSFINNTLLFASRGKCVEGEKILFFWLNHFCIKGGVVMVLSSLFSFNLTHVHYHHHEETYMCVLLIFKFNIISLKKKSSVVFILNSKKQIKFKTQRLASLPVFCCFL